MKWVGPGQHKTNALRAMQFSVQSPSTRRRHETSSLEAASHELDPALFRPFSAVCKPDGSVSIQVELRLGGAPSLDELADRVNHTLQVRHTQSQFPP